MRDGKEQKCADGDICKRHPTILPPWKEKKLNAFGLCAGRRTLAGGTFALHSLCVCVFFFAFHGRVSVWLSWALLSFLYLSLALPLNGKSLRETDCCGVSVRPVRLDFPFFYYSSLLPATSKRNPLSSLLLFVWLCASVNSWCQQHGDPSIHPSIHPPLGLFHFSRPLTHIHTYRPPAATTTFSLFFFFFSFFRFFFFPHFDAGQGPHPRPSLVPAKKERETPSSLFFLSFPRFALVVSNGSLPIDSLTETLYTQLLAADKQRVWPLSTSLSLSLSPLLLYTSFLPSFLRSVGVCVCVFIHLVFLSQGLASLSLLGFLSVGHVSCLWRHALHHHHHHRCSHSENSQYLTLDTDREFCFPHPVWKAFESAPGLTRRKNNNDQQEKKYRGQTVM